MVRLLNGEPNTVEKPSRLDFTSYTSCFLAIVCYNYKRSITRMNLKLGGRCLSSATKSFEMQKITKGELLRNELALLAG